MFVSVKLFIFCVVLNGVFTQTLDNLISEPAPVTTEDSKTSSISTTDSKWQQILPALQTMKSTSKIKKERLHNIAKIIKFLLADENENKINDTSKICEEIKEKITEPETNEMYSSPVLTDYENIVEEKLKSIQEVIDDKSYMLDKVTAENKTEIQDTPAPKNKTADFSKILSKISTALAKLKEHKNPTQTENSNLSEIPTMMVPIFRPKNGCKNDFNPTLYENSQQLGNSASSRTGMNPIPSKSMFNIPCQRASDILEETANYPMPKEFFYDNQAANLRSLAKNTKLNLDNLPFENVVPNSVTCVDSDDSIAILFKPKTISLMQVYGNLLKKLTVTVLVPYYVSKLPF
ncbi:hypothetical protein B5X24_HaOG211327 [Helicoverpa armigera]|uniref:Uncharacterized protein n=1 Tax=Helicoverpa armigera TaxID=29058 RepID=A0A2W1BHL5_HELAM|nr:hypothetical protein B5X24_HaOG211327 [Helicoverpa armigera]